MNRMKSSNPNPESIRGKSQKSSNNQIPNEPPPHGSSNEHAAANEHPRFIGTSNRFRGCLALLRSLREGEGALVAIDMALPRSFSKRAAVGKLLGTHWLARRCPLVRVRRIIWRAYDVILACSLLRLNSRSAKP